MKTKLDFGSGDNKDNSWYNVEGIFTEGVDNAFNFDEFPYPLPENQFEYVKCRHVLEHLAYPDRVLYELWKSCKDGALIEIKVPHVNSKSAYGSLQHKSFFNMISFTNFFADWRNRGLTVESQEIGVQRYLKWLPKRVTNFLAVFIMNINIDIDVVLRVHKKKGVKYERFCL